jgi:PAS domain S-box-containing protein
MNKKYPDDKIYQESDFAIKLLQLIQNPVMVINDEGEIVHFNEAYERLTGYAASEILMQYFWDIQYPEEQRSHIKEGFYHFLLDESPYKIDGVIVRKTGEHRTVKWEFNRLKAENSQSHYYIFSGTDITDILKKEKEYAAVELKFRQLFEKMLTGILIYKPILNERNEIDDFRFLEVNPAYLEQAGFDASDLLGKTFKEVFGAQETFYLDEYNIYKKTGKYLNYEEYLERLNKYFRIQLFELVPDMMVVTFDDVTETKRMEQKVIESVVNIEERGYKRIARDLHDELGPQLASMNVYVSSLLRKTEVPEQREILSILKDLIKDSIARVREISNNLTPNIIERYGLIAAINTEIDTMRLILPISLEHNIHKIRFDPRIEISVYRIIKELLNNTKKYAGATMVTIELNYKSEILFLHYRDNGIGFDFKESLKKGNVGMGLLNIESRVKAIHGRMTMTSLPNEGLDFSLEVPVCVKGNMV